MCDINSTLKALSEIRIAHRTASFVLLFSITGMAQSTIMTYTDEALYLADLAAYTEVTESFESSAWDSVRSGVLDPQIAPSITSQGLTWQNRFFPDGGVTTTDLGNVYDGSWLFYASPHGGYDTGVNCDVAGTCSDGFTITSTGAGTLYGVGGWFTGVSGPEIKFLLDDTLVNGAGGTGTGEWQFFGVIDTSGFNAVEIFDSSGTLGDQNLIFADAFTIGVTTLVPVPAAVWLFGSGLIGLIGLARRKQRI